MKTKYLVGIREVHINTVEVEAETPAEARMKANEMICSGCECDLEYSHTLDPELWTVEKK